MKEVVAKVLKKALKENDINFSEQEIKDMIETPPNFDLGDYAFPCYRFVDKFKLEPHQIALQIRSDIGEPKAVEFSDIQTKGAYINFFVNRSSLARQVIWDVINQKKNYGKSKEGKRKKIVVEFSSPNIAKPFGIAHLRSTIIGNSIANLYEFRGYNVKRINYLGDWGTQFGRVIFGYKKFGSEKKLEKEPVKHLYNIYVKTNKKSYEEKARNEFKKLGKGKKESLMLWKLFRNLSLREFKELYKKLNIKFDDFEGESKYDKKAKKLLEELKKKELVKKSKGAFIVDLEKDGLKKLILEKSDGTTLYATRDLAAAISRYKKYKFEKMIYEVGQEQKLYFRQIFRILELIGYKWAKNLVHAEHGLYLDKSGKKLSTRKGKNIFMSDILEETISLAKKEIKKRGKKISEKELEERALKVAVAAIFYGDLKNNRKNNMVFDMKKFVSFEGDTGPYILYSYARAGSILEKSDKNEKYKIKELFDEEIKLVKKLSEFPEKVREATDNLNPSIIANYAHELSQIFNEFYHACNVIDSEQEMFRLALVESFRQVLRNALHLLGIEPVEEM